MPLCLYTSMYVCIYLCAFLLPMCCTQSFHFCYGFCLNFLFAQFPSRGELLFYNLTVFSPSFIHLFIILYVLLYFIRVYLQFNRNLRALISVQHYFLPIVRNIYSYTMRIHSGTTIPVSVPEKRWKNFRICFDSIYWTRVVK